MFHMHNKKIISVTSHPLYPVPLVTNCHTSDPSSVTYFMDGPFISVRDPLVSTVCFTAFRWSCTMRSALLYSHYFPSALSPLVSILVIIASKLQFIL